MDNFGWIVSHVSKSEILLEYGERALVRSFHGIVATQLAQEWKKVLTGATKLVSDGVSLCRSGCQHLIRANRTK